MQQNRLHIVSFDVPYPPDYGGAVDLFYKLKSLHEAGCEIYLHCFEYGRGRPQELNKYCKQVFYYKRTTGIKGISLLLPYIVASRKNPELLANLQKVDAPILFEGIHTTFYLSHPSLAGRYKAVRTHNIEHEYFLQLAAKKVPLATKIYYHIEAMLAGKYEASLGAANSFFSLSLTDTEYFKRIYPNTLCKFIAPFHPYDAVTSMEGSGEFCLYHGNLSHPENREAIFFLLNEVIPHSKMQFIIAGKNPAADITEACGTLSNCTIIANPDNKKMDELVAQAHIHVLPTFQQSGMKLKLLSALFGGRHVVVNEQMLAGTGLNTACHMANDAATFIEKINELVPTPFTSHDKQVRANMLLPYDKTANAHEIMKEIRINP